MAVGLVGSGNIARALARGWGDPVLATDAGSGRAAELVAELGGRALAGNAELADRADIVVLCHKPAQLEEVAREVAGRAPVVASVLAGVTLADLRAAYGDTPVFRLMPNTPVEVRQGVTAIARDPDADPARQLGGQRLSSGPVEVGHHDGPGTLGGEPLGERPSDAAGAAGDYRDRVNQPTVGHLAPS